MFHFHCLCFCSFLILDPLDANRRNTLSCPSSVKHCSVRGYPLFVVYFNLQSQHNSVLPTTCSHADESCEREPDILLNIAVVSSRDFKAFSTLVGTMKSLYLLISVILLISQAMPGKPYSASIFLFPVSSASLRMCVEQ